MTPSDKTPKRGKAPPRAGADGERLNHHPKEQTTAKAGKKRTENKAARKAENKGSRVACNKNLKNGRAFSPLLC